MRKLKIRSKTMDLKIQELRKKNEDIKNKIQERRGYYFMGIQTAHLSIPKPIALMFPESIYLALYLSKLIDICVYGDSDPYIGMQEPISRATEWFTATTDEINKIIKIIKNQNTRTKFDKTLESRGQISTKFMGIPRK